MPFPKRASQSERLTLSVYYMQSQGAGVKIGGLQGAVLLRDRPSDGAALTAKIIAIFFGDGCADLCGYCKALRAGNGWS